MPNLLANWVLLIQCFAMLFVCNADQNMIFISPDYSGCNFSCSGTYQNPFDSLFNALLKYNNSIDEMVFVLFPQTHYFMSTEYHANQLYYDYTNNQINRNNLGKYSKDVLLFNYQAITIKPLLCSEFDKSMYPNCYDPMQNERIILYLKTTDFRINCTSLNISSIILDGNEDIITLNMLSMDNNYDNEYGGNEEYGENEEEMIIKFVQTPLKVIISLLSLPNVKNLTYCMYNRIQCCEEYDLVQGKSLLYNDVYCIRPDIYYFDILALLITKNSLFSVIGPEPFTLLPFESTSHSYMVNISIKNVWIAYCSSFLLMNNNVTNTFQNILGSNNYIKDSLIYITNDIGSNQISNCIFDNYINKFSTELQYTPTNFYALFTIKSSTILKSENILDNITVYTNNYFTVAVFNCSTLASVTLINVNVSCILENCKNRDIIDKPYANNGFQCSDADNFIVKNSTFWKLTNALALSNIKKIHVENSQFIENGGFEGSSIIYWLDESLGNYFYNVFINTSIFINNSAHQGGAGIHIAILSFRVNFTVLNSEFYNNSANATGGGAILYRTIDPYMQSKINILSTIFENNTAAVGGAIFIKLLFFNQDYIFVYKHFNTVIENVTFVNNTAHAYNDPFSQYTWNFFSTLDSPSNYGCGGAFYYSCSGICKFFMNNTIFKHNKADTIGGALYVNEVNITNTLFVNNTSGLGGAIFSYSVNYMGIIEEHSIINTSFVMNKAILKNVVGVYGSELGNEDESTNEDGNGNGSSSSSDTSGEGGAIYYYASKNSLNVHVTLKDCIFNENKATRNGGGIAGHSLYCINSTFYKNKAMNGGALYMSGDKYKLSGCSFTSNHAIHNPNNNLTNDTISGKGGALYGLTTSTMLIANATIFMNNIADISGGAINFQGNIPPYVNSDVLFINNTALLYGPDIASYGVELGLLVIGEDGEIIDIGDDNTDTLNVYENANKNVINKTYAFNYTNVQIAKYQNIFNITTRSGIQQPYNYAFILIDNYGQIVKDDNYSFVYMIPDTTSYNSNLFYTIPYSLQAEQGSYLSSSVDGDYTIGYMSNSLLGVSVVSSAISSTIWTNTQTKINFQFRPCKLGEIYQDNICVICPLGFYSLENNPTKSDTCLSCMPNAYCFGGSKMVPNAGYWRKNSTADLIIQCLADDACLGSSNVSKYATITGNCSIGYKGNLCNVCERNFTKFRGPHCEDCIQNAVYYFVIFILELLIRIVILVNSIRGAMTILNIIETSDLQVRKTVLVKILINYSQFISLIEKFHISFPSAIESTLKINTQANVSPHHSIRIICLWPDEVLDQFFTKSFVSISIPMSFVLICFLLILTIKSIKNLKTTQNSFLKWLCSLEITVITSLLVFLVYFHQGMLQIAFSFFECINIYKDDTPEYYLIEATNIQCFTGYNLLFGLSIALPLLIMWGILIPLYLTYIIYKNKNKLDKIQVKMELGFLIVGLKTTMPPILWQVYCMVRQLLSVLVVTFITLISVSSSIYCLLILLAISLIIHLKHPPFKYKSLNDIEMYSIASALIINYLDLYFTFEYEAIINLIIQIAILIANALFLFYWLIHYLRAFGIGFGGKIEAYTVKILGNPEGLVSGGKLMKLTMGSSIDLIGNSPKLHEFIELKSGKTLPEVDDLKIVSDNESNKQGQNHSFLFDVNRSAPIKKPEKHEDIHYSFLYMKQIKPNHDDKDETKPQKTFEEENFLQINTGFKSIVSEKCKEDVLLPELEIKNEENHLNFEKGNGLLVDLNKIRLRGDSGECE